MIKRLVGWVGFGLLIGCGADGFEGKIDDADPKTKDEAASSLPDRAEKNDDVAAKPGDNKDKPGAPAPVPVPVPAKMCDRAKPFGAPALVAGLPADQHASTPRLSADELTVFFTGREGEVAKLRTATRKAITEAFGAPQPIATVGSNGRDNDPSISADGLSLFFSSERNGDNADVFVATRANKDAAFAKPSAVTGINTESDDGHPYFRASAKELWFSSSRSGKWEIYVAPQMGNPKLVKELSGGKTQQPMITEDGLTIIFASDRNGGGRDLFQATRASVNEPFATPTPIDAINSGANESAGWLSPDNCRVYFSSDRNGGERQALFVASRDTK